MKVTFIRFNITIKGEICEIGVPVSKVTSRDVTPKCKEAENSENYKAVIDEDSNFSVFSIKEEGKDKIVSYKCLISVSGHCITHHHIILF